MTLTIRTDKPEAEIGLFSENTRIAYKTWIAHRQLAETIHTNIHEMLKAQGKDWIDVSSVACYRGPGSFTGLRIGLTVGNTLASSLRIPIVAESGDVWIVRCVERLKKGENDHIAIPEYGHPANVTQPNK